MQALSFGGSGHRVSAEIYVENTGTGTPFRWSRLVLRMPDGSSAGVGELPPDASDFIFVTLPFVTSTYWNLPQLPHGRYELTYVGNVLAVHGLIGLSRAVGGVVPETETALESPAPAGTDIGADDAHRGWGHKWAALVCVATIVLAIGAPLVGRGIFIGTDVLRTSEPWIADTPSTFVYRHGPVNDTVDSLTPQRSLLRDSIFNGHFALWNPYSNGGAPLGSTPGPGLMSPLNWPLLLLGIRLARPGRPCYGCRSRHGRRSRCCAGWGSRAWPRCAVGSSTAPVGSSWRGTTGPRPISRPGSPRSFSPSTCSSIVSAHAMSRFSRSSSPR